MHIPGHALSILSKPTAYLDPGSGSLLIQIILASLLAIGVAARIYWKRIKDFFQRNKSAGAEDIDPTSLPEDNDQIK
jgi:hypothetical protein